MSTGFVLNIPQEMLNRLEDADKKIEQLARTSEDAQTRIVSAFKSIGTHGLDAFITKINEVQSKLSQLGNTQINVGANTSAFTGLTSQAQNVIDEVNRIVAAMGKVKKAAGDTGMAKNPFAGMTESLKDWNNLQSKIDEADQKIKKLTSTTMDYERQMERIRSGQQIPVAISYNEYVYAKDKIAALQEEKKVYQEKQAEITKQNNALSEQVRIQESLKRFVMNQNSLPEQRKRQEYEAMRQMYIEDEKASEAAEKKKVKAAEKAEKERQKLREKRIREEEKAYERMYKQLPATINTKQAGQLVARSMDATSINQRLVAIKNLQAAINNLDSTDKRYDQTVRKLNSEINRQKEELKKLGVEIDKVRTSHRSLMDISGQLARKLALVFSVSQITGYVKKLIEVRGEFELQQRSLQAILQNKDEANRIWQQTVDLAVRSPFRVKELVSYTKQLAAYRIESDKLFETNKMLADISAGLGVDMQRLILAFGQVRSAAYLRGTELRQFTEAGIPILEQLAQYFTELEGRAVSVGDVFERVSKRMVSFADVEEIFKRMTSEGGTFYRMQEIQAETLQGQISNLKDSVDIMLNDIGKANEGTLKNSISFVRSLIENWESLANTLKVVVAAFAMTKLNALLAKESVMLLAIDMGILTNASQKQLTVTQLLSVGWNSFTKSIKNAAKGMKDFVVANPKVAAVLLLVSAFWKVGKAAWDFRNTLKEIDKQYASIADKQASAFVGFRNALNEGDLQKQKAALSNLINLANNEYNMEVKIDITGLSEEELNEEFNKLRQKLIEANAFASEFAKEQERSNQRDKWWSMSAFLGWDDDMFKDIDDMGDAYTKLNNRMVNMLPSTINMLQERFDSLSESQKELLKSLNTPIKKDESLVDYFNRLKKAFESLSEEGFVDDNKFNRFFRQFERSSRRAKEEFNAFIESFNDEAMSIADKDERTFFLDIAIDKYSSEKNWSEFEENQIRKWIEDAYNIKFNMVMVDGSQTLEPWADRVYGAISKINDEIKKKSEGVSDADLFPLPKVGQTKEAYLALAKEVIGIAEMTYNETQQIEDESMVNRTKALAPYADEIRKILNLYKETGDKDTFTPMLRTIKEIYQEFKKLQGSFDDLTAKEGALAKFGDAFKEAFGKTPEQMGFDLFSEEGVKAAYDYLISKAPDAKKKIQAQLAKGEIVWDVKLQTKKDADKELLDDIQELFDQYDLSLELKKLNIPPDLAKSLFDVDYLDLEGLKKAVQEQEAKFVGTDMEDEYKKFLEKINDLSRKQREDEAKEFVNFLKKNLDEVKRIQDTGAYNIALADRLFGEGKITAEQYMLSVRQIINDTNKEVGKINFEKLKDSATYIKAMGNLAAYSQRELKGMAKLLEDMIAKGSKDMSVDEIKAIYEALEKINKESEKFEPIFRQEELSNIAEYLKLQKQYEDEQKKHQHLLSQEIALKEKAYEIEKKLAELRLLLIEAEKSGDSKSITDILGQIAGLQSEAKGTESALGGVQNQLAGSASILSNMSGQMGSILGGANATVAIIDMIVKAIYQSVKATVQIFREIKELSDSFGAETEKGNWREANKFFEGMENFNEKVMSGWENLKSGNAMGAIADTIGTWTGFIRDINKWIDSNRQEEIDNEIENIERLEKEYERLNKDIDEAYSIKRLQEYNEELVNNIELQKASYRAMIAAEEAKKDTDPKQVEAWDEELAKLEETLSDIENTKLEGLGGVTDFRGQTRSFVDAWVSAYKETGNGLKGLQENFRDFFDNIIAEQAALRVTEKFLEPFYGSLNDALKDYELTAKESQDLRKEADKIMPELSKALELIWTELGGSSGEAEAGKLSALQKGIQGMTEDQAEILTAYWNSVRGYAASIDSKMDLVLANLGVGAEDNPMLEQMRLVANNTSAINTLLNSLVKSGHTQGGLGLKVFMD